MSHVPVQVQSGSRLDIRLMGTFALSLDGQPVTVVSARQRRLIAWLLLHPGPQSRTHLAELFWPESDEAQALTNLRSLLTRILKDLPWLQPWLLVTRPSVGWNAALPVTVDVLSLREALKAEVDDRSLTRVQALHLGELLPEESDEWILPLRRTLQVSIEQFYAAGVRHLESHQQWPQALSCAQRWLALDELNENAWHAVIQLLALTHGRISALQAYKSCAEVLARELQVRPGPALHSLHQQLQRMDSTEKPPVQTRPLVGRHKEWQTLQSLWKRAATGRVQLVVLSGEAGVGKTHLMEDLARHVGAQGGAVASARCYGLEGQLAFAPVQALLRARPARHLAPVWRTELSRLLPELGANASTPSGQPQDTPWQRQRLFEAMARALLEHQPLLLTLDDIQWCDQDSLEWIRYLLRFDPTARMMLVLSLSSESSSEDGPLSLLLDTFRREGLLTLLALPTFGADDTRALVHSLTGSSMAPALLEKVHHESQGNCLYVVELVREGLLRGDVTELPIPDSIGALMQLRLSRLSPDARRLVDLAAVIGRQFSLDELSMVSALPTVAFLNAIEQLQRQGIMRELPGEMLEFAHHKLGQYALARMSTAARRMLHLRVAEGLEPLSAEPLASESVSLESHPHEGMPADWSGQGVRATGLPAAPPVRLAGEVGTHFERAGRGERAVQHFLKAGQASARVYATREARQWYAQALKHLGGVPGATSAASASTLLNSTSGLEQRWEALRGHEDANRELGDVEAQKRDLQAMARVVSLHPLPLWRSELAMAEARFILKDGRMSEAMGLARDAVRFAEEAGNPLRLAHAWHLVAQVLGIFAADSDVVRQILEAELAAQKFARQAGVPHIEVELLCDVAATYGFLQRLPEAEQAAHSALSLALSLGDRRLEALAHGGLARVHESQGQFAAAFSHAEAAANLSHELRRDEDEARYTCTMGYYCYRLRRLRRAIEFLRQAIQLFRSRGRQRDVALWLESLGSVYRELGAYPEARGHLNEALLWVREQRNLRREREILARLARVEVAAGRPLDGLAFAEAGLKLDLTSESIPVSAQFAEPELRYSHALALKGLGRFREAQATLQEAQRLARLHPSPFRAALLLLMNSLETELALQDGELEQAEQLMAPVLSALEQDSIGIRSPEYLWMMMSRLREAQGRSAEAADYRARAQTVVDEVTAEMEGSPLLSIWQKRVRELGLEA